MMSRTKQAVATLWRRRSAAASLEAEVVTEFDPLEAGRQLLGANADRARAVGIDRPMLWLSFDCDTDRDAVAAERIEPWLRDLDIRASYAVPGVQIERGADIYARLARDGAEFMNHGYQPHTTLRDGWYNPITFYDQMSPEAVLADVRRGHEAVVAVTGTAPRGFRAPHFGSFQTPEQLALLHDEAKRLRYSYCSTTVPQFGLDHGPVVDCGGIHEIPLSGSLRTPGLILDSWCHLEDKVTYRLSDSYFDLMKETVDFVTSNALPCLLSYYVDPAHVEGQTAFLKAIEYVRARGVDNVRPADLLAARATDAAPAVDVS
jgi:hypothetical protein